MCESHLDHHLLTREVEARVAELRGIADAPEPVKADKDGILAWARALVAAVRRKVAHV